VREQHADLLQRMAAEIRRRNPERCKTQLNSLSAWVSLAS
jgi:hypothetical protein